MNVDQFIKRSKILKSGTFSEDFKDIGNGLKSFKVTTENITLVKSDVSELGLTIGNVYRLTQEPITNTYSIEIYLEDA